MHYVFRMIKMMNLVIYPIKINALLAYAEANEVHQQEYQRYLTKKTQLDPMTQLFNKNAIENKYML